MPRIVIVWFPNVAFLPTLTVMVELPEPGAAIRLGLKVTVCALPSPVATKWMAELKPPEMALVIEAVPEPLLETLIVVGDALRVKLPDDAPVTVSETVAVFMRLPDVPVTVILYVPFAVEEATIIFMMEVPAPTIEVGLKLTVTPAGWPVADKEIVELKPLVTVVVIVEVSEFPFVTDTEVGDTETSKPGADELPARAVIRAVPFGLPQPVAKS